MELRNSPLWEEVREIAFREEGTPPAESWFIEFRANDKEVKPMKMISMEIFRDYRGAYGDEISVRCDFSGGTFFYDIYPYRQNLTATLRREVVNRGTETPIESSDIEAQEFSVTLITDVSQQVEGARASSQSRQQLDIGTIVTVDVQLIDKALEHIRMYSVGGLFRDTSPPEVLRYILTTVSNEMTVDEENKIQGVRMVESPNTDAYRHIVVPHGTYFPDLPVFLHNKVGGIYPTGMGVYLQKNSWFVYPLYDLTRFDQAFDTLTLVNVPTNELPEIERTYRTTETQVTALVTGEVKHKDISESRLLNEGNGVRYFDARTVMDGFAETGNNKAKVMRAENNNEYVVEQRGNGMNNVRTSDTRITANKFAEMSKIARRTGSEIQCVWENSNIDLVYPGMPVQYMYLDEGEVKTLKGVVLGAQHYVQTRGIGYTDRTHITTTALHLFVERVQPTA